MRLIFKSGFIENKCPAAKSKRGVGWTERLELAYIHYYV